jgi:hypothetical protein
MIWRDCREQKERAALFESTLALFGLVCCGVSLVCQLTQGNSEVACGSLQTVGARFEFIYVGR